MPQNDYEGPIPTTLWADESDEAPQYVSRVHQFPVRSTRSGLVRDAGGGETLLAYGAFEELGPVFTPSPSTPDPQTIREAPSAPDGNDWRTAMDWRWR